MYIHVENDRIGAHFGMSVLSVLSNMYKCGTSITSTSPSTTMIIIIISIIQSRRIYPHTFFKLTSMSGADIQDYDCNLTVANPIRIKISKRQLWTCLLLFNVSINNSDLLHCHKLNIMSLFFSWILSLLCTRSWQAKMLHLSFQNGCCKEFIINIGSCKAGHNKTLKQF